MLNMGELRGFIIEAKEAGYAGGGDKEAIKEPDGSNTILYERGDWKYSNNYYGGEPFGGREVVFLKGTAIWIMGYRGEVFSVPNTEKIYSFLKAALMRVPYDMPFRGPIELWMGDLLYENLPRGNINCFSGRETITRYSETLFETRYIGGLVGQR